MAIFGLYSDQGLIDLPDSEIPYMFPADGDWPCYITIKRSRDGNTWKQLVV